MTYQRFIDRKDKEAIIKSCPDFRFRQHGLPPSWALYSFIIGMLVVVLMINYMSVSLILVPDSEQTPTEKILIFLIGISSLLLGIAFAAYFIIRRISFIVLHTEFQNLLFSGSAALYSEFMLITHPQHGVVYFDYSFDRFFADSTDNPDQMERLLSSAGLKEEEKKKLVAAIAEGKTAKIPFSGTTPGGEKKTLVLQLDPVERPKGFVVIRAYPA